MFPTPFTPTHMPGGPVHQSNLFAALGSGAQPMGGGGGGDVLGWLKTLMGGGQQVTPASAPAPAASPVDAFAKDLENQIAADPIAQEHAGDPDYEQMLKAELMRQLDMSDDPSRAISAALAAAGAAITGGKDVWGGITEGVSAYHNTRNDKSGRMDALKGLVALEGDPLETEERQAKIEETRARTGYYNRRPTAGTPRPADFLLNESRINRLVEDRRDELMQSDTPFEDIEAELQAYEDELRTDAGLSDAAPQSPGMPEASPDTGGAPGEIYQNPATGQRVYWDGQAWVDVVTRQPVEFGG